MTSVQCPFGAACFPTPDSLAVAAVAIKTTTAKCWRYVSREPMSSLEKAGPSCRDCVSSSPPLLSTGKAASLVVLSGLDPLAMAHKLYWKLKVAYSALIPIDRLK